MRYKLSFVLSNKGTFPSMGSPSTQSIGSTHTCPGHAIHPPQKLKCVHLKILLFQNSICQLILLKALDAVEIAYLKKHYIGLMRCYYLI